MKRTLSLVLAFALLLTMAPIVMAEGTEAKEPVTLQIYHGLYNLGSWDGWINDLLTERIGVRVESVEGCTAERTQAMLAAGDLPDIGNFSVNNSLDQAITGGLVVDLGDHFDKLPCLTENVMYGLEAGKELYCGGRGYYGLVTCLGSVAPEFEFAVHPSHNTMNLKWDVYQAIGAPEVADMFDLIDVLKQMVEYQPELEDGAKTWGLGITAGWNSSDIDPIVHVMMQKGFLENRIGFYWIDGTNDYTLVDMFSDDSPAKEALRFYYECNQAGLLDPDSISMYYSAGQAKITSGVYMMSGYAQWSYEGTSVTEEYKSPYFPISAEWQHASLNNAMKYGGNHQTLSISSSTAHLDECLALLNLFYDYDFAFEMNNGPKGLLWDVDENGDAYATAEYQKVLDGQDIVLESGEVLFDGIPFLATQTGLNSLLTMPGKDYTIAMSAWEESREYGLANVTWLENYEEVTGYHLPMQYFNEKGLVAIRPDWFQLKGTFDEDTQMLYTSINDLVMTSEWKMILAKDEAEFESVWNEMKDQAYAMGYEMVQEAAKQLVEDAIALNNKFSGN